jgi:hypothetical protein
MVWKTREAEVYGPQEQYIRAPKAEESYADYVRVADSYTKGVGIRDISYVRELYIQDVSGK